MKKIDDKCFVEHREENLTWSQSDHCPALAGRALHFITTRASASIVSQKGVARDEKLEVVLRYPPECFGMDPRFFGESEADTRGAGAT